MKIKVILWAVLGLSFAVSGTAHAKISLNEDFEGTLMITTAEGKVVMVDAGNPVPAIESGSTLEAFQGKMTVTLEKGDQCYVGCLGQTGAVSGPATLGVECGEETGTIHAIKGEVVFDDAKVAEGKSKTINLSETKQAATTAAGEEIGTEAEVGIPPVDSRSIETSPNQ